MPALVNYDITFLNKSWVWLNDPEIKALTMTPDFSKEEQQRFFNELSVRKDYWVKGIIENGEPIGAMGLKKITEHDAEYWGYIGDKNYWGMGIGSYMIDEAIKKAASLHLLEIYLQVDSNNDRAKKLYLKKGFQIHSQGPTEKYLLQL